MEREEDIEQAPLPPQLPNPVCPHCGLDPAVIGWHAIEFAPGMRGVIVYCQNPTCRRIHAIQVLEVPRPANVPLPKEFNPLVRGRG